MRRYMLPALMAAAAAGPSHGGAGQAPERPPDSHDLRRPRGGDVVVEVGGAQPERAQPYAPPRPAWRYRPLGTGARLCRAFLAPRYVVADPARFGVPVAPPGQQWIRYWDDLLLVERATRKVLRAVPGGYR
ncbi:MAG TPA: RcnB family protein [Allosphingosinicella sp.]|nr:RcnB family protein [Allosphingosinicella sp.]